MSLDTVPKLGHQDVQTLERMPLPVESFEKLLTSMVLEPPIVRHIHVPANQWTEGARLQPHHACTTPVRLQRGLYLSDFTVAA